MSKDLKSETSGDEVVDGAANSIQNLSITESETDILAAYAKYRHLAGLDSWEADYDPSIQLPDFQPTPYHGEWPPKPKVWIPEEGCDICGGDHWDSACSYRNCIPENITTRPPKLDLSKFSISCCGCYNDIVDGGVHCKSCPPGTKSIIANHVPRATYDPPSAHERPYLVYTPTPVLGGGASK